MDNTENRIFDSVIEKFREQYPNRNIEVVNGGYGDWLVRIDDEVKFNTSGYNLLYNLQRLCGCLADELI